MNKLHDIVLPTSNWMANVLQPGYWIVVAMCLCIFFLIRYWRINASWQRIRKDCLQALKNTDTNNPAQLNAILFTFLYTTKAIPPTFDIRNRDEWRKVLILKNKNIDPSFARCMAYYYRQQHAHQLSTLRQQTIQYLQSIQK